MKGTFVSNILYHSLYHYSEIQQRPKPVCLETSFLLLPANEIPLLPLGSSRPSFDSAIENITVNVGREAVLECHVNHLGKYKVVDVAHMIISDLLQ